MRRHVAFKAIGFFLIAASITAIFAAPVDFKIAGIMFSLVGFLTFAAGAARV